MSLRGRNEKYESIKPATNGSEDLGLTVKFRNSVTGRSREIMLIPPVNVTMWHAAAMQVTAALSFAMN
ncbi:MAG TPA: hypothetical protein EYG18_05900 [Micavibrio sp.]|nr:hypothetical protein [Pseudomonadota bacterium]HIF26628.1 hypothetical protein [Micavibrio sp.]HIL28783.1 hypothetical protein [Micavibrio sp.]